MLTGVILTATYTPESPSIGNNLSNDVTFGETSIIPVVLMVLVATVAYVLSQKLAKRHTSNSDIK